MPFNLKEPIDFSFVGCIQVIRTFVGITELYKRITGFRKFKIITDNKTKNLGAKNVA